MKTMYPADNVGKDGTVYPTVGEHIRETSGGNSNLTAEDIGVLTSSELAGIKAYLGIV